MLHPNHYYCGFRNKSHEGRINCPFAGRVIGQRRSFLKKKLEAYISDADGIEATIMTFIPEASNLTHQLFCNAFKSVHQSNR
jgi:hypothetical protein